MRHNINASYGWLTPCGILYGCKWADHLALALEIVDNYRGLSGDEDLYNADDELIKKGYMKLTNNLSCIGYGWWPKDCDITQAQLNTIYEWCDVNDAIAPNWILRKLHFKETAL